MQTTNATALEKRGHYGLPVYLTGTWLIACQNTHTAMFYLANVKTLSRFQTFLKDKYMYLKWKMFCCCCCFSKACQHCEEGTPPFLYNI